MADVVYGSFTDFIFKDAFAFLKKKRALPSEEYKLLDDASRAKAFTVSGYTAIEVLQQFLDCLTSAAEEGKSIGQFREEMNDFLENNGYEGLNPWKADNIFRTNLQTAFNAGHYKSMTDPTVKKLRPYWQYRTAGDDAVRESHAEMDGRVYAADDPIWKIWYPPNGFRCRCRVVSLTRSQVERRGLQIEKKAPYRVDFGTGEIIPVRPDKGFGNNPAVAVWQPDVSKLSDPLKRIFRERKSDHTE